MRQYPEKVMFLMKILEKLNYSRWEIEFLLKNKDIDYLASLYGYDEQLKEK